MNQDTKVHLLNMQINKAGLEFKSLCYYFYAADRPIIPYSQAFKKNYIYNIQNIFKKIFMSLLHS